MSGRPVTGVWISPTATGSGFDVAIDSLPERSRVATEPGDAIAVVGGAQWWQVARRALDEGAIGLILTDLAAARVDELAGLADLAAAASVPVVIDRALLRTDLVDQAVTARGGAPARLVNVDVSASAATMFEAVRDVVGWVRELCGPLRTATASWVGRSGVALLETRDAAIPVALTLSTMWPEGRWPVRDVSVLHVSVLGETRTGILLDPMAGRARVATTTAEGEHIAPPRREARERLAIRRILGALADCGAPDDIAGTIHDVAIVDELVRAGKRIDVVDFANSQSHLP